MFSLPLKDLLQKQLLCRKLIFSMAILHLWSNNTNEEIHFLAKFQVQNFVTLLVKYQLGITVLQLLNGSFDHLYLMTTILDRPDDLTTTLPLFS